MEQGKLEPAVAKSRSFWIGPVWYKHFASTMSSVRMPVDVPSKLGHEHMGGLGSGVEEEDVELQLCKMTALHDDITLIKLRAASGGELKERGVCIRAIERLQGGSFRLSINKYIKIYIYIYTKYVRASVKVPFESPPVVALDYRHWLFHLVLLYLAWAKSLSNCLFEVYVLVAIV